MQFGVKNGLGVYLQLDVPCVSHTNVPPNCFSMVDIVSICRRMLPKLLLPYQKVPTVTKKTIQNGRPITI